jgi:uncharacterized membrane protein HdeD (DUF308 family)
MKQFKWIDFYVNIGLIAGCLLTGLFIDNSVFLPAYFIVGGWQVLSMAVHTYFGWFTHREGNRFWYHCLAACCVALMLLSIIWEPFLGVFAVLLFLAPVMAIYYIGLCYKEVSFYMVRPMDLLK